MNSSTRIILQIWMILSQEESHSFSVVSPSSSTRTRVLETAQQQRRPFSSSASTTALNLFSMNSLNRKPANKTEESEETAGANNDFAWVEGLQLWPAFGDDENYENTSTSTQSSTSYSKGPTKQREGGLDIPSSARYRGVNPLASQLGLIESLLEGFAKNQTSSGSSPSQATSDSDLLNTIADQLFKLVVVQQEEKQKNEKTVSDIETLAKSQVEQEILKKAPPSPSLATRTADTLTTVEDFLAWEKWAETLQRTIKTNPSSSEASAYEGSELSKLVSSSKQPDPVLASNPDVRMAARLLKDATNRIEYLVNEASTATASVQELVVRASQASKSVDGWTNDIVKAAEAMARDRGLNVQQVTESALETTRYAANMVSVANILFAAGYAKGSKAVDLESIRSGESSSSATVLGSSESELDQQQQQEVRKPLLSNYASARAVSPVQYPSVVIKGAEMGTLAGVVYDDHAVGCQKLGHSLVANGTTTDVAWMVSDSMAYEEDFQEVSHDAKNDNDNKQKKMPIMVRTITIRGFDASDESVDRERILNTICSPEPTIIDESLPDIAFHSGLLQTARDIYDETKKYIEWTSPNHKIVFNGHSIGGSLSILLLLIMTLDKGTEYVQQKVLKTYSHGSPPIARKMADINAATSSSNGYDCGVLESFGLESSMVYSYIQPWDPIVRFLTEYDALYPLVDDLGEDDITLYSSGPPRSLRPIARTIFQSWENWPSFRENWKTCNQTFRSVGIQHLLLPEPLRYLNDRFVTVSIGVPPTDSIVRISSMELLPALDEAFPLDVFQISFVPQAVRSFVHHFFPAYDFTIANYAAKIQRKQQQEEDAKTESAMRQQSQPPKP